MISILNNCSRRFSVLVLASFLFANFAQLFCASVFAQQEETSAGSAPATQNLPKFALPAAGSMQQDAASAASASSSAASGTRSTANTKSPATAADSGVKTTTAKSAMSVATAVVPLSTIYRGTQAVPKEITLPNGLRVLVLENHEFPVVSTLVWYRVGSRDEQTGATGLGHMVEHLMFQDVGPFKPGDIGSSIARVGGQFNGYTSDDFTTFFETLPSNKLEMALKIESERMHNVRFSDTEVKQEIANIQKELESEAKDPVALLSKEVRAMMFMQHPYHNPTIGWKTDLEGLSAEHAREFYQKYFNPANATLIVSGDVNAKQVDSLVRKYFGESATKAKPPSHVNVNEPLPRSERRVNTKYSGNKEVLQVAYRSPALDDADAPAAVVLERLLNGGMQGKLKGKLIDGKICQTAQANYEIKKDAGLFTITCTAIPATFDAQNKILAGVDSVVAPLRDKPVSDAELRRARNQAEFAYFAECDGPYRAGFHLGYFESLDKWQNAFTWPDRIRSVTAADVNRVARKYFGTDSRVVGWLAGTSAAKAAPPKATSSTDAAGKEHDKTSHSKQLEHVKLTGFKLNDNDPGPSQDTKAKEKAAKPTAKTGIPAVIRDIPQALGNAVTGNIPGAVGNVGSALINIPGAIGNIGTAVGTTASVIGKQIVQLKPGSESEIGHLSHRVLKNGIRVVVFKSDVSPVVQICGSIQAGEAYTAKNKPGYSLLAANLLSQGSAKRPRAQMAALQDDMGIATAQMLKFDSNIETIDFSSRCLSRDLPTQLDLIAETLSQPCFDEAVFDKAKQDALAALKRNEDGLGLKVDRLLLQGLLDDNSPLCPGDPSEKAKSLNAAELGEAQKFFSNNIVPGATTIVVAGDYLPEQVYALVERAFSKWNGKSTHAQQHAKIRAQRVMRSSLPVKDSKKTHICFGQVVPISQSQGDYGSLLIADGILVNHPMISRFEQALCKNPALDNAIANGDMTLKMEPYSNLTRWSLSLALEPSAVPASVKAIKTELQKISGSGITADELNEAKRYLLGSLPVRTQATLGAVCSSILDSADHTDTVNAYNASIASIKSASIESVNKVIRSAFKPEQSLIVVAGPAASIKATRTANSDSGPTKTEE